MQRKRVWFKALRHSATFQSHISCVKKKHFELRRVGLWSLLPESSLKNIWITNVDLFVLGNVSSVWLLLPAQASTPEKTSSFSEGRYSGHGSCVTRSLWTMLEMLEIHHLFSGRVSETSWTWPSFPSNLYLTTSTWRWMTGQLPNLETPRSHLLAGCLFTRSLFGFISSFEEVSRDSCPDWQLKQKEYSGRVLMSFQPPRHHENIMRTPKKPTASRWNTP